MRKDAAISLDQRHRYELTRRWGSAPEPWATWVMLNPSTADATTDDATIRRCIGFAERWGCGGIRVVNLYAWRATDPERIFDLPPTRAIGPLNDDYLARAFREADGPVVFAWGARAEPGRVKRVELLAKHTRALDDARCLGWTAGGNPRHPLRLPYSSRLVSYSEGPPQ